MYTSPMFRQFNEDPFFSGFNDRTRFADDMFAHRSPFLALNNGSEHQQQPRRHDVTSHRSQRGSELMPMGQGWDPFGFMDSIMPNMNNMMETMYRQMERVQNDPNSHCIMQSSVLSYTNDGSGQPRVYQATTSSRQAPGGIRETRKAVRDSEAGIEKMAIGRHINDRAHVVTRQRSTRTGDIDENQDYINMDESDVGQFSDEWARRTSQYASRHGNSIAHHHRQSSQPRALDYNHHSSRHDTDAVTATGRAPKHQMSTDYREHSRKDK